MDINNCQKSDYLRCAYNLDFVALSTLRSPKSEIMLIELDEIGIYISFLEKQDYKYVVRVSLLDSYIYFIWNSSADDFLQWTLELEDIPQEQDDELKFLDKFLSYAESITNSNDLYNKRRINISNKYKLR